MTALQIETSKSAPHLAADALRLCLQGRMPEGLAMYRHALTLRAGRLLPVGRHVRFMERAGEARAAAALRRSGMLIGADVSSCSITDVGDDCEALAEYRALFSSGVVNGQMLANYMVRLSRTGAAQELRDLCAPELLFRQSMLPVDCPREFLRHVSSALRSAPSRKFHENDKSIRRMERIPATNEMQEAVLVELHRVVRGCIARYIHEVSGSGHLIGCWLPQDFRLYSWGVISSGMGYHAPHIHSGSWVVAIVYIEGEDPAASSDTCAGVLRIGPGVGGDPNCAGWPDLSVMPIPGTLILMPSYYTHWTTPVGHPSSRISIAFNAIENIAQQDDDALVQIGGRQ